MRPPAHARNSRHADGGRCGAVLWRMALALSTICGASACAETLTPEPPPPPVPAGRYVLYTVNGRSTPYSEPDAGGSLMTDTLWLHADGSFQEHRVWYVFRGPGGPYYFRTRWSGQTQRRAGAIFTLDSAGQAIDQFTYTSSVAPAGLSNRSCYLSNICVWRLDELYETP